jgi:hypothetical protein
MNEVNYENKCGCRGIVERERKREVNAEKTSKGKSYILYISV